MAYCKPIETTHNAAAAMRYCVEKDGEPRSGVKTRGLDCSDNWRLASKEMKLTRDLAGKDGGVEAHLGVISFRKDEFAGKDGLDRMLDFGEELAKELHPDCQCWLAAHDDGTGGMKHLHFRWNHVDNNGKLLATSGELNKMKRISDRLCKEKGLSVIPKKQKGQGAGLKYTLAEKKMLERGQKSWKEDIRQAIIKATNDSLTIKGMKERLAGDGITVSERAGGYTFTDKAGHKVRGARLGADFTKEGIKKELQKNRSQGLEITVYANIDEARAAGITNKQMGKSVAKSADPRGRRSQQSKSRDGIATMALKMAGVNKDEREMVAVMRDCTSGAVQVAFAPAKAVASVLDTVGSVAGMIPIIGKPLQMVCKLPKQVTDVAGKVGDKVNRATKKALSEEEDEPQEINEKQGAAMVKQLSEAHKGLSNLWAAMFDEQEQEKKKKQGQKSIGGRTM